MKKSIYILSLIISILSCNSDNKNKIDSEKNNSVVIVEIANAENEELVLSVKGEDFENRKTQSVKNGKAIFNVGVSNSDVALIQYNYNVENVKVQRRSIPLLLNNDTIVIKTEMVKDSIEYDNPEYLTIYNFKNKDYKKSNLNINYRKNSKKLFDLAINEPISNNQLVSINKKVFPMQSSKMINLFENEFSNLNQRVQLELFHKMLNFDAFEPEYLNDETREAVNNIYYSLSNLDESANYRLKTVEYLISNINNYGTENQLNFKNFNLIDSDDNKVDLKDIVKQNELTVFYFWFSSCGPCRSFNQKIDNEIIKELNENDIKFVSINTDINKEDWIKSSKQDNIFWQNLYGGNSRDDIEFEYGFRGYPFKVIFNKSFEVIEFSFSKPKDLLELKEL